MVLRVYDSFSALSLPYIERHSAWIATSTFHADFAFALDQLTLVMLLVVTGVGFLIHIYSVGYMAHEEGYWRFFAYLNLFMFFMLTLVLAENFLLMFVGWEGVGLASYLLIGFYFKKRSAANAGKKAFIVNRIGDFGFLLAMFLLIVHFGTLSFSEVASQIAQHPEWQSGFLTAIALLLVLGATGKSAQIPLYVWLPDAMEGPTPVSALIHAATMVTAGVYMVARTHVIFDRAPLALTVVAIIGAATAFFAATIGILQTDIKRVLAYSTISQLGYMFLACGAAAYSAAIFHLVTHAFFKALLFLAAGSVIHALSGEQDMRVMGGLRKYIPVTFWTMTMAVFAISGFPPFSGFFSKDEILAEVFRSPNGGHVLWAVGLITAGITSFYMFRLWYLTFFGHLRLHTAQHEALPVVLNDDLLATGQPTNGHHGHAHPHAHAIHESPEFHAGSARAARHPLRRRRLDRHPAFPRRRRPLWPLPRSGDAWRRSAGILRAGVDRHAHRRADSDHRGSSPTGRPQTERMLTGFSVLAAVLGWLLADTLYRRKPELPARSPHTRALFTGWSQTNTGSMRSTASSSSSRCSSSPATSSGADSIAASSAAAIACLPAARRAAGAVLRRIQSGNIRSYAGWLAIGAAIILLLSFFGFGAHLHMGVR